MSALFTVRDDGAEAASTFISMEPMTHSVAALEDTERARAGIYRLLGILLADPPSAPMLDRWQNLDGGEGALGDALRDAAHAARCIDLAAARAEYDALFIGISHGEVIPYASFYITGFLHDRPLAGIRADMAEFGISLVARRSDPEDHIATVFEVMASLIDGAACVVQPLRRQQEFFMQHIDPWAARFFADLAGASAARLYRPIAALGCAWVALEYEAFQMEFA